MQQEFSSNPKFKKLCQILRQLKPLIIATSGGKDSLFLLTAACSCLQPADFIAVNIKTPLQNPQAEKGIKFSEIFLKIKIQQLKVNLLQFSSIRKNSRSRCYQCKKQMFKKIRSFAISKKISNIADASTISDLKLFRPGMKALQELQIFSPLAEAGISEAEILAYLKKYIPHDFLNSTTCLATRFPYGHILNKKELLNFSAFEKFLHDLSLQDFRARYIADGVRLEIPPQQWDYLIKKRQEIISCANRLGFQHITLDLQGLKRGCWDQTNS